MTQDTAGSARYWRHQEERKELASNQEGTVVGIMKN
jgi:hypothetical protein